VLNIFNLLFYSICFVLVYQHLAPSFSNGAVGFRPVGFLRKLLFGCFMYFAIHAIGSISILGEAIWSFATLISDIFEPDVQVSPVVTLVARPVMVQIAVWLSTLLAGLIMPGTIAVPSSGSAWQAAYASSVLVLLFYLVLFYKHLSPGSFSAFIY
jgi:hypothetical protein